MLLLFSWSLFIGSNGEGFITEKDYLCLLDYLEGHTLLPKNLYAAFEECKIPMAGVLSYSQFATWVRQYTDVVEVSPCGLLDRRS